MERSLDPLWRERPIAKSIFQLAHKFEDLSYEKRKQNGGNWINLFLTSFWHKIQPEPPHLNDWQEELSAYQHVEGDTASAVTFSIIQTAIANNLDPYTYLNYIFTEAPQMAAYGEDWVQAMRPQNVSEFCKAG